MTPASLLLKVYYERLYERMAERRELLLLGVEERLSCEIERRYRAGMDEEKRAAYRDACVAFIDERLETYNPIGVQYTFGHVPSRTAAELEFQLNWYNSKPEFAALVATARSLAEEGLSDEAIGALADELIGRAGAFPDRSIIAAYLAEPGLQKLPDFVVACVIEETICGRPPSP